MDEDLGKLNQVLAVDYLECLQLQESSKICQSRKYARLPYISGIFPETISDVDGTSNENRNIYGCIHETFTNRRSSFLAKIRCQNVFHRRVCCRVCRRRQTSQTNFPNFSFFDIPKDANEASESHQHVEFRILKISPEMWPLERLKDMF